MIAYYNGCRFESKNELRFALSIENDFAYILHPKRIYDSYYRENGTLVEINERTPSYKPDFLIRSYSKNISAFIEIKPANFSDREQYDKRNRIMERHLSGLDSKPEFIWVFSNEIRLSDDEFLKYKWILERQAEEEKFFATLNNLYPNRNKKIPYSIPETWSNGEYLDFVVHEANPASD